ncbi:MAG: nitrilase-related carbon-nitrogen hydrolase [Desulfurococcaceae archaeon]
MIIGIIQEDFGINSHENFEKIKTHIERNLKEADIILTPEYSMVNILKNLKPEDVYNLSEELENSSYLSKISDLSGKYSVNILTHFIEKTSSKPKCYNSSIIVKPSGSVEKVYSKLHLFDAYNYRESDFFNPGKSLSQTILIKNKKFYTAICYDIRFPELFRLYASRGAYGVFVHAGWVKSFLKEELLDILARSRSHENTMYIVIANQTGELYTGRSGVYNPYGFKELDLGFKPKYCEYKLDLTIVDDAREQIPVVKQALEKWSIEFRF